MIADHTIPRESLMLHAPPKQWLDRMREVLRLKHSAIRTATASLDWARHCILFHSTRHPRRWAHRPSLPG